MKIDAHIHFNSPKTELLEYGVKQDIGFVSIVTDIPGFPTVDDQLKTVVELKKAYGDYLNFTTTFTCASWGSPKWVNKSLDFIKKSLDMGAIGVKVWKNIGMTLQDKYGSYPMIDHPSFEPIFNFLEENNVVVLGHNGEPKNCWLPFDQMTVESDRSYFMKHPEYHMHLHPEVPDYKAQLSARDRMLERHPKLRFVGLHLASLEWDVNEIAAWLDRFPLAMVDLAERIVHVQHQTVSAWQKVHDFFIKYQDRIIYGTDFIWADNHTKLELMEYLDERYQSDWDYFSGHGTFKVPEVEGNFKGLGLPSIVLNKIFNSNAKKTYGI
ncbi:amidohydrolase family protein [Maribacter aurantiacus]|uniref:Hydrolase n=1 Tax=Maribacter aurantiacus TaxID=1882343 RepID=A0A5R8MAR0_9FLAO|nr:amidohydrolase family protein [Maribacter aurantiacus]TLF45829.1 hydrolase [Maribacter aurantiacus]